MSTNLTRRQPSSLVRQQSRLPRHVAREVETARYDGLIAATRIESAAFVTHVGLSLVESLTTQEAQAIQRTPLGEARYRAIADSFAGLVCNEIGRLGW